MNESEQTSFMAMQSLTTINHVDAWQHISMWDDASAIDYPPSIRPTLTQEHSRAIYSSGKKQYHQEDILKQPT